MGKWLEHAISDSILSKFFPLRDSFDDATYACMRAAVIDWTQQMLTPLIESQYPKKLEVARGISASADVFGSREFFLRYPPESCAEAVAVLLAERDELLETIMKQKEQA